MARTISKRAIKAKGILAAMLLVILGALTAGYLLTERGTAAQPAETDVALE